MSSDFQSSISVGHVQMFFGLIQTPRDNSEGLRHFQSVLPFSDVPSVHSEGVSAHERCGPPLRSAERDDVEHQQCTADSKFAECRNQSPIATRPRQRSRIKYQTACIPSATAAAIGKWRRVVDPLRMRRYQLRVLRPSFGVPRFARQRLRRLRMTANRHRPCLRLPL